MATKFIYFLIAVLTYLRSFETYFLSDDLDTNLPERFGDPIEENWQDKRSAVNEHSSFSVDKHNDFPDTESMDFDYRNGNAETQIDDDKSQSEMYRKRESNTNENVDEVGQYF